ncbi:MAG: hypothetical protein P8O91_06315 [Luminiphilus sp.]|nr:hypothetical protein [Luminiphilus sp.]
MSKPVYVMVGGRHGDKPLMLVAADCKKRDYPKAAMRILGIFGWLGENLTGLPVALSPSRYVTLPLFLQNIQSCPTCGSGLGRLPDDDDQTADQRCVGYILGSD